MLKYLSAIQTWSYFSPQQVFPDSDFYPNSQSATFNPRTGKIYYFGGSYYLHTNYGPIRFPFSKTYIFNTIQGTWSLQPLAAAVGSSVPSDRIYHTTTLCKLLINHKQGGMGLNYLIYTHSAQFRPHPFVWWNKRWKNW